jgi:hypothetical protein
MSTKELNPKLALNKAFLKIKPNRNEIEIFKSNLITLLDKLKTVEDRPKDESEEHLKNDIRDFLRDTFYKDTNAINTKDKKDLVIHTSKDTNSKVGVIIEAKRPSNKGEMLSKDNLNKKALQELVLYYLRERITHKNLEVKHLIITNINEWYIFDEYLFERLFNKKELVKQFESFEHGKKSTSIFYKEIAEPFIQSITNEIEYTYFNLKDYESALRNQDKKDDKQLIELFKLLSPPHLLKLPFNNDSNSLDKNFYGELLHIIGLVEVKDGGKKLIQRPDSKNRNSGSLLENTINQLDSLDKLSRLTNPKQYGDTPEERLFNVGLELCITWVNRILFLKLLEAQLISYHKGDKSYSFLNQDLIHDYDNLNSLFFMVLAKKPEERNQRVKDLFSKVPYLNSSLFEPTDLEHEALFISGLEDNIPLPFLSSTVIKDNHGNKEKGSKEGLKYLFDFLSSYDFTSDSSEDIQEDNKTLINASVLGLIFEKINGYKDGSFFTPGFITEYMCRETIRRAVVQKFNEVKSWDCKEFEDLYNKIDDIKEANQIVNQIKICDPAVGSGHFLVSALNEMISLKHDLEILQDSKGKKLKNYRIEVVNDELIISDREDGELFEYNPLNDESQRIQETLFHEKQTIIENCLFGVDINPNSVKICRLRLWIELLKNAYYKNPNELETLPNIDINIKCGNSLVSRFSVDTDLKEIMKKSKWSIDEYKKAVDTYRNAESKDQKREMELLINDIKSNFRSEITNNDPKVKRLYNLNGEITKLTTQQSLFEPDKKEKILVDKQVQKLIEESKKINSEIEEIKSNKIYENAFEWRFEFPEVLNEDGDFIGFDMVIGNPPYGMIIEDNKMKKYFSSKFISSEGKHEIFKYFIEFSFTILKSKGLVTLITPDTWLQLGYFNKLREYIFNNFNFISTTETLYNVFEEATVDTLIFTIKKEKIAESKVKLYNVSLDFVNLIEPIKNTLYTKPVPNLIVKIEKNSKLILGDFTEIWQGLIAYGEKSQERIWTSINKDSEFHRKLLFGGEISKYSINWKGEYLKYGEWLHRPRPSYIFDKPKILVQRIRNPKLKTRLVCALDKEKLINGTGLSNILIDEKKNVELNLNLEFILGIINSKLINYWFSFYFTDVNIKPEQLRKIPFIINTIIINEISTIVNLVIESKKQNQKSDTTNLENQIDQLVYQLYDLTPEEIEIIEGS